MKLLKVLGYVLLGFIGLAVAIVVINPAGHKAEEAKDESQPKAEKPVDFKVTAVALMAEYKQNELAADAKYKGKTIEVSGRIGGIDKEITGKPYVTLKSSDYDIFSVQCLFGRDEADLLLNLKVGNPITLKGRVEGKLGNILVEDCSIVK